MAPRPSARDTPTKRPKLTADLNTREWAAVDYVLDTTRHAHDLAALDPDDKPTIAADLPDDERAELVDRIADYELRAELKDMFGTLDLPTDQTNVTRLALRYLARSIKGARTRAALRATEADPVYAENTRRWLEESAAELVSGTGDDGFRDADFRRDHASNPILASGADVEAMLRLARESGPLIDHLRTLTMTLDKLNVHAVQAISTRDENEE